jgi:hypothetical protein
MPDVILAEVGRLDVPAERRAIDFSFRAIVTDATALHFLGHGLAQLVRQTKADL